jgi:hypothetical protein
LQVRGERAQSPRWHQAAARHFSLNLALRVTPFLWCAIAARRLDASNYAGFLALVQLVQGVTSLVAPGMLSASIRFPAGVCWAGRRLSTTSTLRLTALAAAALCAVLASIWATDSALVLATVIACGIASFYRAVTCLELAASGTEHRDLRHLTSLWVLATAAVMFVGPDANLLQTLATFACLQIIDATFMRFASHADERPYSATSGSPLKWGAEIVGVGLTGAASTVGASVAALAFLDVSPTFSVVASWVFLCRGPVLMLVSSAGFGAIAGSLQQRASGPLSRVLVWPMWAGVALGCTGIIAAVMAPHALSPAIALITSIPVAAALSSAGYAALLHGRHATLASAGAVALTAYLLLPKYALTIQAIAIGYLLIQFVHALILIADIRVRDVGSTRDYDYKPPPIVVPPEISSNTGIVIAGHVDCALVGSQPRSIHDAPVN